MTVSTRKKTDVEARRRDVGRLYLSGKTQTEIAKEQDVTQATISRDLKALREQWLASALIDINEAKGRELAKIDALEVEYWEAWRRSIGEQIRERTKAKGISIDGQAGSPKQIEKTVQKFTLIGDPRFLQGIERCIDKRCKILGLDAPQIVEVSWQDEIVDLLAKGEIEPEQIEQDFGASLVQELFTRAGVNVSRE